jgi:hypothetical protein
VKKAAEENNKAFDDEFEHRKARLATTEASASKREAVDRGHRVRDDCARDDQQGTRDRHRACATSSAMASRRARAYEMFAKRIREAVEAKDGLKDQIEIWKSIEEAAH